MVTSGEERLLRKDLPGVVYVTAIFAVAVGSFVGAILLASHPLASRVPILISAHPYGAVFNWFLSLFGFGMSVLMFLVRSYVTNNLSVSFFGISIVAAVGLVPLLFGLGGFLFLVPLLTILAIREQKQSSNNLPKADPR